MLFVAHYSMKGPAQALTATALLSLLTVWFAPFGVLLGAIIALVTLRIGSQEGLKTLLAAITINAVGNYFLTGSLWPTALAALEYMVPVWLMALVLRNTNALATALNLAMIIAGFGVISFHLWVGEPVAWWNSTISTLLLPLLEQAQVEAPNQLVTSLADVMTLLLGMFAVTLWFTVLLLARWWQSALYYPGGFKEDFLQLRMPKNLAYFAAFLALAGLFLQTPLLQDLSGVMMAGLMFPGLAIVHHAVSIKGWSNFWLVAVYVLMFVFPQMILILATLGLIDAWLDIRNRWSRDTTD